jgi:hypothetical protein
MTPVLPDEGAPAFAFEPDHTVVGYQAGRRAEDRRRGGKKTDFSD